MAALQSGTIRQGGRFLKWFSDHCLLYNVGIWKSKKSLDKKVSQDFHRNKRYGGKDDKMLPYERENIFLITY